MKKTPAFTGRNVPISELAKATGKSAQFIRVGLQTGVLTFGFAIHQSNSKVFSYYCPDKLVYEQTGYFNCNITDSEKEEISNEAS